MSAVPTHWQHTPVSVALPFGKSDLAYPEITLEYANRDCEFDFAFMGLCSDVGRAVPNGDFARLVNVYGNIEHGDASATPAGLTPCNALVTEVKGARSSLLRTHGKIPALDTATVRSRAS